jgi:acyl carrier protein
MKRSIANWQPVSVQRSEVSKGYLDRINKLTLTSKRLALLALELHERLEASGQHAPVAVIGIGCRFPGGANDPAAFWQLLREGPNAIREVPAERWDMPAQFDPNVDAPAKMSVRHGGFLDHVDGFDAAFFGIAPREAIAMDPRQRMALEVSWEALELAGIVPESLVGSATGAFLGVRNSDQFQSVLERGSDRIDTYLASGNAHSLASGRAACFLVLQGPALSIDTACSSSLVALRLACQSLRSGVSQVAPAGGVNLMCSLLALPEGAAAIADDQAFGSLGLDSLTSVELRNRLQAALDWPVAATAAFEWPTVASLAAHLSGLFGDAAPAEDDASREEVTL